MKVLVTEAIFWFSLVLAVYVYAGYPLLLALLARLFPQQDSRKDSPLPRVSLLISAFNEKQVISDKIENALNLECPSGQLEIIVISDCSDDGTDEVVAGYSSKGVRLVRQSQRLGKTAGLNLAIPQASGDVLVFSDANAMYQSDAIRRLIEHFANPQIGYVVGNARYVESLGQPDSAEAEGLYWKLETWLKEKESAFGSMVGGDGAIYAIRRQLFTPLQPTDINDFLNPLQIITLGYRGMYEPSAVCFEEAGESFEKEFRRKVRIISRSLNAVRRAPQVLLPWVQPRHWFSLLSHKVFRWTVPLFLATVLLSNIFLLDSQFFRVILLFQVLFYVLAAVGWGLQKRGNSIKLFYIPYYFTLMNLASFLGICKFLTGSLSPTWQTIRQPAPPPRESGISAGGKES